MMKIIENQTFDFERALYGSDGIIVKNCAFDGPLDGESALKESKDIKTENCFFNLRYPFWHVKELIISGSEMTSLCRAALWYCDGVKISGSKLHGVKALRECSRVAIDACSILSTEFGWFINGIEMYNCKAESEYFMLRSIGLHFGNVELSGKYSFQYVENAVFENCNFDTKDAFWHAKNVVVKNSTIKGAYLAWYADGLTLENCKIIGTQPLCYCKNLKLINCEMIDADFSFEKSEVTADLIAPIISIKNPLSGRICVPAVGEVIMDDKLAKGEILIGSRTGG